MIGRQDRRPEDLFMAGPLRNLIPDDHILRRVIADPEVEGFLSRIRPPESSEAGTPVEVVFSRVTFEEARKKAGSLSEQLATGEREEIDAPLVLTTVKLAGE